MSRVKTSRDLVLQIEVWRLSSPEGAKMGFYSYKKLNYTYIVRHPKKLKVKIK